MKMVTKYTPFIAILTAMLCVSVRAGIVTGLHVQAVPFKATEGLPAYNVKVATFTDSAGAVPSYLIDRVPNVTNYSATITWGDGSGPYTATLVPGFHDIHVLGTHTYTEHGNYLVMVQVSDLRNGRSDSDDVQEVVSDAPLHARGALVSSIEAVEFTKVVATFTDDNPYGTIADFSGNAMIDWGDKSPATSGTVVTNELGGYAVVGTHTYAHQGSYGYRVKILDIGGSEACAGGRVAVSDAPLDATALNISVPEGSPYSGMVATFSQADTTAGKGEFSAVIAWGEDASTVPADDIVPNGPPGTFAVYGSHTYTTAGSYPLIVHITSVGGSSADPAATATVGEAPLVATGVDVSGTEGFLVSQVVANLTDENPYATASDYTVTIDWGDGSGADTSSGSVSGNSTDGFTVSGSHVYAGQGTYAIVVTITDNDPDSTQVQPAATARISSAQLFVTVHPILGVEGVPFSGVVASFTDANPLSNPADLSAAIDWGDGGTSTGRVDQVITQLAPGVSGVSYNVVDSHTYTHRGDYPVNVTVYDRQIGYSGAAITATITDAPLTSLGRLITPTESFSFLAVVANFTDANPYGTTNEVTAWLDWGDGTTLTRGTIIPNEEVDTGHAEFIVLGEHQYANQGLYPLNVTIVSDGGSQTTTRSAANTADAPMIGFGRTIRVVKDVPFAGVVANCVDTDTTPEPETTYDCIIDWGDGSTSTGTITEGDEESYAVSGSHTYAQAGSYVVLATIESTQTFVSTTARSTAIVSETPAADLTSQFVIKATRPVLNKRTGIYRQVVVIKNATRQRVTGPVSLVLDDLSDGGGSVTLVNRDGETLTPGVAPVGSPYKNVVLPRNNTFVGKSARSVVLYFSSSSAAITYTPRVLAGPGAR